MINKIFPFMKWIKSYNQKDFISDFVAGTVLAIILIPKSIAYASIAGLPPVYWLYAAILSPAVWALWGSSSRLSTWPAAVISFLVFASVAPLAWWDNELFLTLAILLAFIVWAIQLLMGLFKTGWIMNFVSHSVIVWFVNAAALVIAVTQLKDLLWLKLENTEIFLETVWHIILNLGHTNVYALWIWLASIWIIIWSKKIHKLFPGWIVAVWLFAYLSYYLGFNIEGNMYHVKIVWDIPSQIPMPSFPSWISIGQIFNLIPIAFVISIIWFIEAWSIAKSIAALTKEKLNVNQELIGQWLANIATWFFQWYPVSWSFSWTAVNYSAWWKTAISNVVTSVFIVLSLLFLSPYLSYLPKPVLAAIVIIAVIGLFHPKKMFDLLKTNKADWIAAFATFIAAFCMKLDYAIFLWIIISLVLFLYKTLTPRINEVSKDIESGKFKDIEKYKLSTCPQIMIIKPEMSLYFANTEWIINNMLKKVKARSNIKYLVIDSEAINYFDASAVELVHSFVEDLKEMWIETYFINVKSPIKKTFEHSELHHLVKEWRILDWKKEVITKLFSSFDKSICKWCKNKIFNECKNT